MSKNNNDIRKPNQQLIDSWSDEDLAEACRKLDHQAFQILMRRYLKPIFNFIRQYVKNNEDVDDVTQETFFKVWKYIGKYSQGKTFRPWIYTIARNTALDHIKKKKSQPFSDLDDHDNDLNFEDTLEDTAPIQTEIFETTESIKKLSEKMELLNPDYRMVIVLHYDEGMTFEEIAEVMKKPINTVKSWHRRALIKLKELLKVDLHQ